MIKTINCCGGNAELIVERTKSNTCPTCGRFNGHGPWSFVRPREELTWDTGAIMIHGPMGRNGFPMHDKCGCPILAYWARWKGDDGGVEIPKDDLRFGWTLIPGIYELDELSVVLPADIREQLN